MALFPVDELEALLVLRARSRRAISYAEVFQWFGLPFQRFQVRHLCAALEEVDARQRGCSRPELAALVVRQSDGIPGQGWWLSKSHDPWEGPFHGPEARRFVERHQDRAFDWWEKQA
ncbi:MAG: ribose-phosphate pyrophosphokinase [Sphingomonadaceae bacterium]